MNRALRKTAWFVRLWLAGVGAAAIVGLLIRVLFKLKSNKSAVTAVLSSKRDCEDSLRSGCPAVRCRLYT